MDCQRVELILTAFQDGCVLDSEQRLVNAHLKECRECSLRLAELEMVRRSLRSAAPRPMPAHLSYSLTALASREAARRRRYATLSAWLRDAGERVSLFANNLMRPLALPAAGGLVSAVFLFSMVMTNLQGIAHQPVNDVPISINTEPSVKNLLLDATDAEIAVDVFVDDQGRMIDYSLPEGMGSVNTAQLRRKLENSLLFTEFHPATTFGMPTAGWVRVKFRSRSEIDVKG